MQAHSNLSDEEILKNSVVARFTANRERRALTPYDGLILLVRVHHTLMMTWFTYGPEDFLAKLDAERDLIRLRAEISRQVSGV